MSFIGDIFGGGDAANAATQSASIQAGATDRAAKMQQENLAVVREDLQPFTEAGVAQLPGLQKGVSDLSTLATDPNAQKEAVINNPFYNALAEESKSTLFANQAAKGKVGSGETAKALQNSLLLLGNDLLNQDISRRNTAVGNQMNLATMGQNAAAMQGSATQNTGANISNLMTQGANAQAAGIVGAQQGRTNAMNSGINTGLGIGNLIALSDKRQKTDIKKVGEDDKGLNIYEFRYKGSKVKRVGHMAQEVEKKFKNAVRTIADIKFIDYGVLNAN